MKTQNQYIQAWQSELSSLHHQLSFDLPEGKQKELMQHTEAFRALIEAAAHELVRIGHLTNEEK